MNTLHANKVPGWLGAVQHTGAWNAAASRLKPVEAQRSYSLTSEEMTRFMRVVSECGRIASHLDIFQWLHGDVQHFLPHEVLVCAWGDFRVSTLKLDVTSGLPGVRTAALAGCNWEALVTEAYDRWTVSGRQALLLKTNELGANRGACKCALHQSLATLGHMLIHGCHDKRSGHDSLFIAFNSGCFTRGRSALRFTATLEPVMALIDAGFRKIPAYPMPDSAGSGASSVLDLSTRETEVLESMCRGKTNLEIAAALDISPFTVKNHVQRIFRKIGVTNRTQAAARYADALREATNTTPAAAEALSNVG
jgi:transcriptional regulator EpsA